MDPKQRIPLTTLKVTLIATAVLSVSTLATVHLFGILYQDTLPALGFSAWVSLVITILACSFLLGLVLALLAERRVLAPLQGLIRRARTFSMGEEAASLSSFGGLPLQDMEEAIRSMEDAARRRVFLAGRQRMELERLFDVVPCYITVQDRNFRIVRSNRLFKQDFGDREGQYCFEIYKGRDSICPNCAVEKTFRDSQIHSREEEVLTEDGRTVSLIVYSAPIRDARGDIVAVMEMSTNISEVKRLQRELDTQANKLEQLFNVVPCYISVQDRDLNIVQTNEMFRRDFGDRVGERCHQVYKGCDGVCEGCPVKKTFADGQVHHSEEVVVTRDGKEASVIVYTAPIRNEAGEIESVMEMSTNITDVKMLQRELDAQARQYEQLFNAVPCYISIQDRDLNIVQTNETFRRDFGEPAGKRCHRVYKGATKVCEDCPVKKTFADGRVHSGEEVVITKDGKEASVIVYAAPIRDEKGEIESVMEMSTNITEVKKLQRELALMGRTMAGMAHSIKNILMGLEGGIFVVSEALQQKDDALLMEGWDMVHRNVAKVSHIVKDLLYCAKEREPEFERTDPVGVARQVFELFQETAKAAEIEIGFDAPDTALEADLDPDAIQNLLNNLLANAIDACKFDFSKENHWVRLRVRPEDPERIVFEVEDNGKGIPREAGRKVFDDFFSTKGNKGTGLGLLVARKIVEEHSGEIRFDSEPDQGTTFRVILPLRQFSSGE